jgi:hypothetical protein
VGSYLFDVDIIGVISLIRFATTVMQFKRVPKTSAVLAIGFAFAH